MAVHVKLGCASSGHRAPILLVWTFQKDLGAVLTVAFDWMAAAVRGTARRCPLAFCPWGKDCVEENKTHWVQIVNPCLQLCC